MSENRIVPYLRFSEFHKMPEWKFVQLSDLGQTVNGLVGKSGNDFGSGKPYVTYKQVFDNSVIDFAQCGRVQIFENENQNPLRKGDVLFTTSSETAQEVGFASVVLQNPPESIYLNSFCFAFRPFESSVLIPEFSRYFFHTSVYRSAVSILGQGSTRFNISKGAFLSLRFALPDLAEQQKIADCLSSLDDVINAQTQKLELLKAHKKGLMQDLFPAEGESVPRVRFGEFEGDGDWESSKILDIVDKDVKWSFTGGPFGSNLQSSDYTVSGIRVIQLQNIGDGKFNNEYKIFTSFEKADELLSCNIYPGDILISKMGDPVGRACLIPDTHDRYVMCSDGIRVVVDEKIYHKYFIYSLINSTLFRSRVENNSTGSTRKRIGLDVLKNIPMAIPRSLKEQRKIGDCLSSLDDQIQAQTQKIESLKLHIKGLMQQLFPNPNP